GGVGHGIGEGEVRDRASVRVEAEHGERAKLEAGADLADGHRRVVNEIALTLEGEPEAREHVRAQGAAAEIEERARRERNLVEEGPIGAGRIEEVSPQLDREE